MENSNLELVQQELKVFRSQLFKIDLDEDSSKQEIKEILDKYLPHQFEPFAEEFLIAGLDVDIVSLSIYLYVYWKCQFTVFEYFVDFFFS